MATRQRPADRGARAAAVAIRRLCDEIRRARRNAGLGQAAVARAAGVSRSRVDRLESGAIANPSIGLLFRLAAIVGLDIVLRAYPAGSPLRDAGHARALARFQRRLHPSLRWRSEVPLPAPGDLRSWDGAVSGTGWEDAVDVETVIDDAQSLERRLMLKRRDGEHEHVILVLADTPRNRDALAVAPAAFAAFPLRTRVILAALGSGRHPAPPSGIPLGTSLDGLGGASAGNRSWRRERR